MNTTTGTVPINNMWAHKNVAPNSAAKPPHTLDTPAPRDPRPRLDAPLLGPTKHARIFDRFLDFARKHPDQPALVCESVLWTYGELDAGSHALALALLSVSSRNNVVELRGTRSPELVLGMLGCLRAGLKFMVLDSAYPTARLEQLRAAGHPGRILAFEHDNADYPTTSNPPFTPPSGPPTCPAFFHFTKKEVSALLKSTQNDSAEIDNADAGTCAYLLFTSGTTGVPKCIQTAHHPLVHFVEWYARTFAVTRHSRFSMLSGLGHDPVLRDIFVPLSFGAVVYIPSSRTFQSPPLLYRWLRTSAVTHIHVTPQMSRLIGLGALNEPNLSTLQFVFSGGDMLRRRGVLEWSAIAPSARIVNFYGTSETPQAMAFHAFDALTDESLDTVPIGRGIPDVQLLVLDENQQLADIGTQGQIAIRTKFLSLGYLGDAQLTHAKFIPNPALQDPNDLLYLTGDSGRFREDGAVVANGRLDDQVKIRGYRVEPSEIIGTLENIPEVSMAAILPEQAPDGETRLIACVMDARVSLSDASAIATDIKDYLAQRLPSYMVPFRIVPLQKLPLLPNGKIDRERLRVLAKSEEALQEKSLPPGPVPNQTERAIMAHWQTTLGIRTIGVERSFFELGGDSLSTISAAIQLEEILGVLPEHWEKQSVRELAGYKQNQRSFFTSIDTPVFMRAVSIVAIVAAHFGFPNLAGSVRTLFVVAGMSFGKYLMNSVRRTNSVRAILQLALKIAVPTVLYTVLIDVVLFRNFKWQAVFLLNNLLEPDFHKGGYHFWFVLVLVQSLLILAGLLAIKRVRQLVCAKPFESAWSGAALMAGVAALTHIGGHTAFHDHVPTVYLGAMFLGWCIVEANTLPRRLWLAAATVLTFIEPVLRSWEQEVVFLPLVATLCLATWRQIPMPVFLGRMVNLLAGGSLFIYLTDNQVKQFADRTSLVNHPWIILFLALLLGIVCWRVWEMGVSWLSRTASAYFCATKTVIQTSQSAENAHLRARVESGTGG